MMGPTAPDDRYGYEAVWISNPWLNKNSNQGTRMTARSKENDEWRPMIVLAIPDRAENAQLVKQLCLNVNTRRRKLFSALTKEEIMKSNKNNEKLGKELQSKSLDVSSITPDTWAAMVAASVADIGSQLRQKASPEKIPQKARAKGKSPSKKGGAKAVDTSPPPKSGTTLKKRGEEGFESRTVDDEPPDGPCHYIIVQGIEDVGTIRCLFEVGLGVDVVLRLFPQSQSLADQVIVEATKFVNPPAPEVIENENLHLNSFWQALGDEFGRNEADSPSKDTLRLDCMIRDEMLEGDLKMVFNQVFDQVAQEIYRVVDLRWERDKYFTNLKILGVEGNPSQEDNFPHYSELLQDIPTESVSIPYLVHSLVEQVLLDLESQPSPKERYLSQRDNKLFDIKTASTIETLTEKLGLEEDDIDALRSQILPEIKFRRRRPASPELINFGDDSSRNYCRIKNVDTAKIREAEFSLCSLLPECRILTPRPGDISPEVLNRSQELFEMLKTRGLSSSESDRVLKLLLFESMSLSSADYCGRRVKASDEGVKPQFPWDFPFCGESKDQPRAKDSSVKFEEIEEVESAPIRKHQKRSLSLHNCDDHYDRESLCQVFSKLVHTMPEIDTLDCKRDGSTLVVFSAPCNHEMLCFDYSSYWLHTRVGLRNYAEHVSPEIEQWVEEQRSRNKQMMELLADSAGMEASTAERQTGDDFITDSFVLPNSLKASLPRPPDAQKKKPAGSKKASPVGSDVDPKLLVDAAEPEGPKFVGYDFGNHLVNVSTSLFRWYPVDAGILKIWTTEQLLGTTRVNVSVTVGDTTFIANNTISRQETPHKRCLTVLMANGFNLAVEFARVNRDGGTEEESGDAEEEGIESPAEEPENSEEYLRLSAFTREGLHFEVEKTEGVFGPVSVRQSLGGASKNEECQRIFYKCGVIMDKHRSGEIVCYGLDGSIFTERQTTVARVRAEEPQKKSVNKTSAKRRQVPVESDNIAYETITEWTWVDSAGNRRVTRSNDGTPSLSKLELVEVVDPESGQKMISREDGTTVVIYPDGTRITEFLDRTTIAYYKECFESPDGEESVEFVKFGHPGYANVLFNSETNSFVTIFPDETSVTYTHQDGYCLLQDGCEIRISPRGEILHHILRETPFVQSEASLSFFCDPESPLAEIVDSDKNVFTVSPRGDCKVIKSSGLSSPDSDEVQPTNRRYFVVMPDGSGYEMIRYCDVESSLGQPSKGTAIYKREAGDVCCLSVHKMLFEEEMPHFDIKPPGLRDRDFKSWSNSTSCPKEMEERRPLAVEVRRLRIHKEMSNDVVERVEQAIEELMRTPEGSTPPLKEEAEDDQPEEEERLFTVERNSLVIEPERREDGPAEISVGREKLLEQKNVEILRNRVIPSFFDNEFADKMIAKGSVMVPQSRPSHRKSKIESDSSDEPIVPSTECPEGRPDHSPHPLVENEKENCARPPRGDLKLPFYFSYGRENAEENREFISREGPTTLRTKNICTLGSATPHSIERLQGLALSKKSIDFGVVGKGRECSKSFFLINTGTEKVRFKITRPGSGIRLHYTPGIIFPGLSKEITVTVSESQDTTLEIVDEFRKHYLPIKARDN